MSVKRLSNKLTIVACKGCGKGNTVHLVHNLEHDNWYVLCAYCRLRGRNEADADRAIIEWNLMKNESNGNRW